MRDYLTIPLKDRLALYKKNCQSSCCYTKPDGKRDNLPGINRAGGINPVWKIGGMVLRCHEEPQFRTVTIKPSNRDAIGYYIDHWQSETTEPRVFLLSHGRYLAGCSDPWNEEPAIIEESICADEDEAKRRAHQIAERYAEMCREDNAKQAAEMQIEDCHQKIEDIREDIRSLCADIRVSKVGNAICAKLKSVIRGLLRERHEAYERIETLNRNFWASVEN